MNAPLPDPTLPPDRWLLECGITLGNIAARWWSRPFRRRLRALQVEVMRRGAEVRKMRRTLDEIVADAQESERLMIAAGPSALAELDRICGAFGRGWRL